MTVDDALRLLLVSSRCSVVDLTPWQCGELAEVLRECLANERSATALAQTLLERGETATADVDVTDGHHGALNGGCDLKVTQAVAAEREECALLIDKLEAELCWHAPETWNWRIRMVAEAIRGRK